MTTDLVVADSQQVAGSQPGAVRRQYPRRQQRAIRACERAAIHDLGGCHPPSDSRVIQGDWARPWGLDPSEGAQYTLVHVTLISCEVHQRPQHASVVGNGGGCQVFQSGIQVGVDSVGGQVAGLPRQTPAQNDELLQVAGTPADSAPVGAGKFYDGHREYSQRVGEYERTQPLAPPRRFATIRPWGN